MGKQRTDAMAGRQKVEACIWDASTDSPEANAVLESLRKFSAIDHELLGDAATQHAGSPGASCHVRSLPRKGHLADCCLDACAVRI